MGFAIPVADFCRELANDGFFLTPDVTPGENGTTIKLGPVVLEDQLIGHALEIFIDSKQVTIQNFEEFADPAKRTLREKLTPRKYPFANYDSGCAAIVGFAVEARTTVNPNTGEAQPSGDSIALCKAAARFGKTAASLVGKTNLPSSRLCVDFTAAGVRAQSEQELFLERRDAFIDSVRQFFPLYSLAHWLYRYKEGEAGFSFNEKLEQYKSNCTLPQHINKGIELYGITFYRDKVVLTVGGSEVEDNPYSLKLPRLVRNKGRYDECLGHIYARYTHRDMTLLCQSILYALIQQAPHRREEFQRFTEETCSTVLKLLDKMAPPLSVWQKLRKAFPGG